MIKTAMQTRILSGFDDPHFGPEQWEHLLHRGETDTIFLTREWQRVWWEAFGCGQLLLIVAEREGEAVALAPLYTDQGMIYFVGSGGSDYLDFVGDVSEPEVLDALLETARDSVPGFLGFEFYMVLDSSRTGARLEAAASRLGFDCCHFDDLAAPALDLAGQLVAALDATRKKSLVRHENYFRRAGALSVQHLRQATEVLLQLGEFFAQHIARWAETDSPSLFLNPAWRTFYERWTEAAGERGWLRFTRLEWEGRAIAFHFGFSYRGQYLWYKPSFAIELQRRSPGEVLLRQLLLAALEEEAETFDFGIGDEAFKYRFATKVNRVRTWGLYPRPGVPGSDREKPASGTTNKKAELMSVSLSTLPDLSALTSGLARVLSGHGLTDGRVMVTGREHNDYAGGSPSEIVNCRLADGRELQLLCKYQADGDESWSDVIYEAEVYRRLLQPLQAETPAFYGSHREESGRTWLILEYLDDCLSLEELADPDAAAMAAFWLGRFHAASQSRLTDDSMSFLKVYDADYYIEAARRTLQLVNGALRQFPWLIALGQQFDELVAELCGSHQTITHGDFHLSNLLVRNDQLHPIDWEMAGITAGEVDLACLIDGWPEIESSCESEYQRARWADGAPADFARRLCVARLALYFCKLSSRPRWTVDQDSAGDREGLRATGEQLGLI